MIEGVVFFFMRLGELRTKTRDLDNKYKLKVALYDELKGVSIFDLEWDMMNTGEIYFRLIDE